MIYLPPSEGRAWLHSFGTRHCCVLLLGGSLAVLRLGCCSYPGASGWVLQPGLITSVIASCVGLQSRDGRPHEQLLFVLHCL